MVTITVPAMVEIDNPRLTVVYWLVMSIAAAGLATRFIMAAEYQSYQSIESDIKASMWVDGLSSQQLKMISNTSRSSDICQSPSKYNYVWDAYYSFYPTGCFEVCMHGERSSYEDPCIPWSQTYYNGGVETLFLVTMRDLNQAGPNGTATKTVLFSPYVPATRVGLSYGYQFSSISYRFPFFLGSQRTERSGSTRHNLLTVALNDASGVARIFDPGDTISFSVPQILELAGVGEDWLDRPETEKSPNQDKNASMSYPAGRLTGGMVLLNLHCSNDPKQGHPWQEEVTRRWDPDQYDAACFITFRMRRDRWGVRETVDATSLGGEALSLYSTGIQIVVQPSGTFSFADPDKIFLNMTSAVVVMKLPKALLVIFITTCLGHLSLIYRRACRRPFSVTMDIASMSARLIANSVVFDALADDGEMSEKHVSKTAILHKLRGLMKSQSAVLDDLEIDSFAKCVYSSIAQCGGPAFRARSTLTQIVSKRKSLSSSPDLLSIEKLYGATTMTEPVDFESAIRLFDLDRRSFWLERFFIPPGVSSALNDMRKHRALETLTAGGAGTSPSFQEDARPEDSQEVPVAEDLDPCSSFTSGLIGDEAKYEALRRRFEAYERAMTKKIETLTQTVSSSCAARDQLEERLARVEDDAREFAASGQQRSTSDSRLSGVVTSKQPEDDDAVAAISVQKAVAVTDEKSEDRFLASAVEKAVAVAAEKLEERFQALECIVRDLRKSSLERTMMKARERDQAEEDEMKGISGALAMKMEDMVRIATKDLASRLAIVEARQEQRNKAPVTHERHAEKPATGAAGTATGAARYHSTSLASSRNASRDCQTFGFPFALTDPVGCWSPRRSPREALSIEGQQVERATHLSARHAGVGVDNRGGNGVGSQQSSPSEGSTSIFVRREHV